MCCKLNPNKIQHLHSEKAGKQKGAEPWNKGKKIGIMESWRLKFPNELIFTKNSTYARNCLKKRILLDNLIYYKCSICDIGPEWMGKPMPLILDHINGINNDNRFENLRFVCGHCDSQLETYKSKNRIKKAN
jgi:hypothetical protein